MVIHIVMFKFKDEDKAFNMAKVQSKLMALETRVPSLKSMEVDINFNESDRAFDLSLYSTFEDEAGLQEYAVHEAHLKVVELIKSVTTESKVVDYIL